MSDAFWTLMIGEMGCRDCKQWNGSTESKPCVKFDQAAEKKDDLLAEICPERELK